MYMYMHVRVHSTSCSNIEQKMNLDMLSVDLIHEGLK